MNKKSLFGSFIFRFFKQRLSTVFTSEVVRLLLLFAGALSLTLILSDNQATAHRLFQSPASPAVAPVPADPVPTQPPAAPPPADQPQAQPPPEQPAAQPPAPVEPVQPAEPGPVEPVQPEQAEPAPLESAAPELVSPVSSPQPGTGQVSALEPPPLPQPKPERIDRSTDRETEEEGSPDLTLNRAQLIDTVVVSMAYVWLCCGIMLFLLIPLVFLFLQIRGRTKMGEEYF